jgi:DNA primase
MLLRWRISDALRRRQTQAFIALYFWGRRALGKGNSVGTDRARQHLRNNMDTFEFDRTAGW